MDILEAIKLNDLSEIKRILVSEPNLIDKDSFFAAVLGGNIEIVKYLVEYSRISLNEYDSKHRNALHYAAMSGNREVFEYLTDRCGLDPHESDIGLRTPWDYAHRKQESGEINEFLERKYGCRYEDFYRNPIRTGFFPDPSICRVGDDYYMVNSSFIFFPCIPISHSKDLIHWEIIGHAITNPKWAGLDELEGGRGYWAPDISYYEGRFYIAATYRLNDTQDVVRRQIVVSSDRPEGPYSEPAFIDEDGIDPGLFNDNDGKRYMLLNRGARIFELDKSGTKKISDAKLLYYGSNKRAPEGPHIYKKDGFYYLLQAEGGTGPGHRVTVARSRELFGVYEACPYNPIMRQQDENALIQRCGHGDLVETADGRWYMVYLCGRKIGDGYSILGRETALDPVTWTADGWPIVNNLKGPSCMQKKPYPDMDCIEERGPQISACGLPFDYMTPRSFETGEIVYDAGKGSFTIKGSKEPLRSVGARNLVLRRQSAFSFEFSALLSVKEIAEGQSAGITGYYDENTYLEFGIMRKDGIVRIYSNEHIGENDKCYWGDVVSGSAANSSKVNSNANSSNVNDRLSSNDINKNSISIIFHMSTDYLTRKLSYRIVDDAEAKDNTVQINADSFTEAEKEFTTLQNVYYLCDEGYNKGKRFTGALVGMYAYAGHDRQLTAEFSNICYSERTSYADWN